MATLLGVVLVLGGLLMIVFHRSAANFINESDDMALQGRSHPLGRSSSLSVLLPGVGLLGYGLWILWISLR